MDTKYTPNNKYMYYTIFLFVCLFLKIGNKMIVLSFQNCTDSTDNVIIIKIQWLLLSWTDEDNWI